MSRIEAGPPSRTRLRQRASLIAEPCCNAGRGRCLLGEERKHETKSMRFNQLSLVPAQAHAGGTRIHQHSGTEPDARLRGMSGEQVRHYLKMLQQKERD